MSHLRFENSPPQLRDLLQYLAPYSRFISCDSRPEYLLHWLHPTTLTINNDYIISYCFVQSLPLYNSRDMHQET
jgi:hypothetical protein